MRGYFTRRITFPRSCRPRFRDLEVTEGDGLPKTIYLLTIIGAELPSPLQIRSLVADLRGPMAKNLRLVLSASNLPTWTDGQWGEFAEGLRRDTGLGDGTVVVIHPLRLETAAYQLPLPKFLERLVHKSYQRLIDRSKSMAYFARRVEVKSGGPAIVRPIAHAGGDRILFDCASVLDRR